MSSGGDDEAKGRPNVHGHQYKVLRDCEQIYGDVIGPINEQMMGPLEKGGRKINRLPIVFLLGNHSSGKSTFINHVLKRDVQRAGVAPTDDSFTIIAPGHEDSDQDGPALIGDPDMGFAGLRAYGPTLISHVQLKVRSGLASEDFMLVDSPGMIDSPAMSADQSNALFGGHMDRGYNFKQVVRWFVEHADVVLLFFDPDKPGTTGETLSVLTSSLSGAEHKLHIIMNKVDQFQKMHDFARAYGSLCWNLSKVIPRKDLPRIYTMCVPTSDNAISDQHPLSQALHDFNTTRHEVIAEVYRAPFRRLDNTITELDNSTRLLEMHLRVLKVLRSEYTNLRFKVYGASGAVATVGAGVVGMAATLGLPWQVLLAGVGVMTGGTSGVHWYGQQVLARDAKYWCSDEGLNVIFNRLYGRQLAEGDEFITALWFRVKQRLNVTFQTMPLSDCPTTSSSDLRRLADILDVTVPRLKRTVAPFQQIPVNLAPPEEAAVDDSSKELPKEKTE